VRTPDPRDREQQIPSQAGQQVPDYDDHAMQLAVARAAHYRRIQIAGSAETITIEHRERIEGVAGHPQLRGDGSLWVGYVYDFEEDVKLDVVWTAETDRVQIGRPEVHTPPSVPVFRPIRFMNTTLPSVHVDDGYIYTCQGVDYVRDEAYAVLNRTRNWKAEGWTWRKIDEDSDVSV